MIKIIKKKGLPFLFNRYRKRKIFAISLLLVLVSLVVLSGFIWNIEITGNETISSEEILNIVKDEGLETGKLKRKIDFKKIVEKIRLNRSDISWVGIKISGTNAVIEIVEADKAPNVINKDDYCNIVANKDAMIVSANAQNGTLQVKEGDVVKQGSVLIAGWLEGKYTGVRYVHATGQVMAKVWYSKKEKVYYKQNERKQTGNVEKKYSINIKNFAINFYKKLSKFEIYDTINTEKKLRISSNFYLPFELIVKENHEVIEEEKNYSKDEAKQIGIDNIQEHEHKLHEFAISELSKLDNVTIYNPYASTGIITFNINGVFAQDAATYLGSKGVFVRSGQHCAKILMDFLKTSATVRASTYFYNDEEDFNLISGKSVHTLSHHPESFLYRFFKSTSDSHNFSDALHRGSDQLGHSFELIQIPARNFTNDIIQSRFETSGSHFCNRIFNLM